MKIQRVELREIRLRLRAPFETSLGRTEWRRILLVRVFDAEGGDGWGECTAPEEPFYNHEFIDAAWLVLREFLVPMLLGRELESASDVPLLFRGVRGHGMAKAAVEAACWDLQARREGRPLWQLLGGTRAEIECGVSLGIQSSPADLLKKVEQELAAGYRRIKVKIKPGLEREIIGAVRAAFPEVPLMADANAAYTRSDADVLRSLDEFALMMLEQPLAHDDLLDHAELQRQMRTPICLDESITSAEKARKALAIGACRIINIKLGRVGGYVEARRIHDLCRAQGVPVWCGGMLESGIGRAHNIALSTLEGFSLPGDVSASRRYWERDIIEPEVEVTPQGTIRVPEGAGIGFAVNERFIEQLTVRREVLAS